MNYTRDLYEVDLLDRIEKIQSINEQYDLENNSYLSFSGGKDSTVVHYLLDIALPNNNIPRVYMNTGIEYTDMVKFIKEMATKDKRIKIINSGVNIRKMLREVGYPFKSKHHSQMLEIYQKNSGTIDKEIQNFEPTLEYVTNIPRTSKAVICYIKGVRGGTERVKKIYTAPKYKCPKKLLYQFTPEFNLKISNKCCYELKKKPFHKYERENNRYIAITGMRRSEGGNRTSLNCIITSKDKKGRVEKFHPLAPMSDEFMEYFINDQNVKLCKLYLSPYNFVRTGCAGCPFARGHELRHELEMMRTYLPTDYKRCVDHVWKIPYDEMKRINYRLNLKTKQKK